MGDGLFKNVNFIDSVTSYVTANLLINLSNIFVSNILAPLIGYLFYLIGIEWLPDWHVGKIGVGSFITSTISAILLIYIVKVIFERLKKLKFLNI